MILWISHRASLHLFWSLHGSRTEQENKTCPATNTSLAARLQSFQMCSCCPFHIDYIYIYRNCYIIPFGFPSKSFLSILGGSSGTGRGSSGVSHRKCSHPRPANSTAPRIVRNRPEVPRSLTSFARRRRRCAKAGVAVGAASHQW